MAKPAPSELAGAHMTPAEFRAVRESLGLTQQWLANYFEAFKNTVQRWENGSRSEGNKVRIPAHVAVGMRKLQASSAAYVQSMVTQYSEAEGMPTIKTFHSDADYEAAAQLGLVPGGMTAAWHRAMSVRISEQLPGFPITYRSKVDADLRDLWSWSPDASGDTARTA